MINNIVNSKEWEEVEAIIHDKMQELLTDFPEDVDVATMACHALANKKAYEMLNRWLKDMGFYRGEEKVQMQRNMK